jgi:hypothetical protein
MNLQNTPEAIAAVPTLEVARWTARIERTNMALRYNGRVMRGGDTDMGDDGALESIIAQRALRQGVDWKEDPDYEDVILYELKPELDYYKVVKEPYIQPSIHEEDDHYDDATKLTWHIGRSALKESLHRLGLYSPEKTAPPIGAVAALSLQRADIREDTDRALYARKGEIKETVISIASLAKPRGVSLTSKIDGKREQVPVYHMLAWPGPKTAGCLGLDPEGQLNPWWQELQRDLDNIDAVSAAF